MANLYLPSLMSDITKNGIMKSDVSYIWRTGGFMLLVAAGGVICAVAASFLGSQTALGLGVFCATKYPSCRRVFAA
jgi:ATP-binding cassette subfamily B protein